MASSRRSQSPSAACLARAREIAQAGGSVALFDPSMRYLAASPQWYTELGIDRGSVVGSSHYDVFPEVPERWRIVHRRGLAGETLRCDEDVFARTGGRTLWFKWSVEPWRDPEGRIGGILIGFGRLVDERRQRLVEDLEGTGLVALLSQCTSGMLLCDAGGRVLHANPRYLEFVGRCVGDVVGTPVGAFLDRSDRRRFRAALARLRTGGAQWIEGRYREVRADGSVGWFEYAAWSRGVEANEPGMIVVRVEDANRRCDLERRLREAERAAALGVVGACAGHDMKNLLLPIAAHLNVVHAGVAGSCSPAVERSLRSLRFGLSQLWQLADAVESPEIDPAAHDEAQPAWVDLEEWWSSAECVIRPLVGSDVRLVARFANGLPRVAIDQHALTRCVLNLVTNALHAIEDRREDRRLAFEIRLDASVVERGAARLVRLDVGDNGCGMSESVLVRAQEPYFTTRAERGGAGLGLAMVRRAMERIGGSLSIASTLDLGTCATLHLPTLGQLAGGGVIFG